MKKIFLCFIAVLVLISMTAVVLAGDKPEPTRVQVLQQEKADLQARFEAMRQQEQARQQKAVEAQNDIAIKIIMKQGAIDEAKYALEAVTSETGYGQ